MSAPYEVVPAAKSLREDDPFDVIGSVVKLFRGSWEAFVLNWQTFVVLYFLPAFFAFLAIPLVVLPAMSGSVAGIAFAVAISLLLLVLVLAVGPAATVTQFESAVGKRIAFDVAFQRGMTYVVRYVLLVLLLIIIVSFGLILFIVPGLVALFFLGAAPYLLIQQNLSIGDSIRQSIDLAKAYWKVVLAVFIVTSAISVISSISVIGGLAALALSVLYYCMPAMLLTRINRDEEPVNKKLASAEKSTVVKKRNSAKKSSVKKPRRTKTSS